jgi:hypothetical protein
MKAIIPEPHAIVPNMYRKVLKKKKKKLTLKNKIKKWKTDG